MRERGFTLVELMVVIGLILLITSVGFNFSNQVFQENQLYGNINTLKGSLHKARVTAIRNNRPVQVDFTGGRILIQVDIDNSGTFDNTMEELVIGEGAATGLSLDSRGATWIPINDGDLGSSVIQHPSGLEILPGFADTYSTFEGDRYVISRTGFIQSDTDPALPVNGAIFMKTQDNTRFALIAVMAAGSIDTALGFKEGNELEWVWQ